MGLLSIRLNNVGALALLIVAIVNRLAIGPFDAFDQTLGIIAIAGVVAERITDGAKAVMVIP